MMENCYGAIGGVFYREKREKEQRFGSSSLESPKP